MNQFPTQRILETHNLVTHFHAYEGVVKALNGVSLNVDSSSDTSTITSTPSSSSISFSLKVAPFGKNLDLMRYDVAQMYIPAARFVNLFHR